MLGLRGRLSPLLCPSATSTSLLIRRSEGGLRCDWLDGPDSVFIHCRVRRRNGSGDSWHSPTNNVARSILASETAQRSLKLPLTRGCCGTELNWTLAGPERRVLKESR